jgi:hypothetical protein
MTSKRFRVAFSFASEKREFVANVASILSNHFGEAAILYDKYHEAEFARRDLGLYLPDLYHEHSDLIVVVLSPDYEDREWCGLEWAATFDLLKQRKDDYVMLCRFNGANVKGLFSTSGFVELDSKTPDQAAELILQRLALNKGNRKDHKLTTGKRQGDFSSPVNFVAAPSRLFRGTSKGPEFLLGRERELADLDQAWEGHTKQNIVTIVAWGGVGKTSLVAHWTTALLTRSDHRIERYFDWSFYRQGTTREDDNSGANNASADIFIKEALSFFGDRDLATSNADAWQKGERLASLVAQYRTLLILDGLEPLQDPKTGDLRDEALCVLLRGLAANNEGLCVVTTRQHLPELAMWRPTTAAEWHLKRLSDDAGAELLSRLGVHGLDVEKQDLSRRVRGHALTLTLLGRFLKRAHQGDIRRVDRVNLQRINDKEQGGHAFRVIAAYERWFEESDCQAELAILRMLGLFDRPATPDCLDALRDPPIPGLTDMLTALSQDEWNEAITHLVELGLVEQQVWEPSAVFGYNEGTARKVFKADKENIAFHLDKPERFEDRRSNFGTRECIDAHPLIREYFAKQGQNNAVVWKEGHSRLFEHLKDCAPYWPEGLEGLEPLYQAVAHGCQAGFYQSVFWHLYYARIQRRNKYYATNTLGAFGSDVATLSCFFSDGWRRPHESMDPRTHVALTRQSAFSLRATGRLEEADGLARLALKTAKDIENFQGATIAAGLVSALSLVLGRIADATRFGEEAVQLSNDTQELARHIASRSDLANALFHSGQFVESKRVFEYAEQIEAGLNPNYPMLRSIQGFGYHELLLAETERLTWLLFISNGLSDIEKARKAALGVCEDVKRRAEQTLGFAEERRVTLISTEINKLTLGRIGFYQSILQSSIDDHRLVVPDQTASYLRQSVDGLRRAGQQQFVPLGLLTRAWLNAVQDELHRAVADLDEAWLVAERGPMRLHLADIHLHRARLFFRTQPYPWKTKQNGTPGSARDDLAAARTMIENCGYWRRRAELDDAERVILSSA